MTTNWRKLFSDAKAVLLRRGRTEEDADDFLQEAYLRVSRHAESSRVENIEGYFMRTALNIAIDAHRANRQRGEAVQPEDVALVDPTPSLDDAVLGRQRLARMDVGLARLTERTRQMFIEYRVEGLTCEEIARRHGLAVSTVQHHVSKALFQLSSWMHGW